MSEPLFYGSLTDEQIEEKIRNLTSFQKKKFEETMVHGADRRQALLIARSYPMDMEKEE